MRVTDEYVFFWNGPFSQWHSSYFWDHDVSLRYNCAEQYMMYHKALTFKDTRAMDKIMSLDHPRDQKAAGREVSNYDDNVWASKRVDVVKRGNELKFSQNPHLMGVLEDTAGKLLVEASPYDRIWGIGLSENDDRVLDPLEWRGQNLLGKVLTELRIELIGE